MSPIIYLALAAFIAVIAIMLYREIQKLYRQNLRLSLADNTNIVMTIVNLVLLVVAVVSLQIAVNSYLDAQESGRQQQQILDASKQSLSSVVGALNKQQRSLDDSRDALTQSVKITTAQQKLLQESVKTSRSQLAVLDAQWKRELEQPDIRVALVYPANPSFIVMNQSKTKPLREGHYQLITLNIDHWEGDRYQMVQTRGSEIGASIPPGGSFLPTEFALRLDPNQPIEKGNRLYGYLNISCPDCTTVRVYWVLIKYGEQGWYAEIPIHDKEYSLSVLSTLTPTTVEAHIRNFLLRNDLIEMPTKLW